ncbi:MAG: sigma-54 dependent transcriptional regulator [Candidatus Aenigmatarchaeota archaeon]
MRADDYEKNHGRFGLVGESEQMRKLYDDIVTAALSDETVFITAESGTGKEIVARAIHENSKRKEKRYTKFNCAAVPLELMESELFGHEKGSFTGAYTRRIGKLEITDGGTFFLDEIADMNPSLQPKILRVVEYKEFERVGGNEPIRVDVRLIAATSKNVNEIINNGTFRPELFYRLNVFPLSIPPLRERREDIEILTYYFIEKYGGNGIEKGALKILESYDWPGNVRELKSVIGRLVLRSNKGTITRDIVEKYGGLNYIRSEKDVFKTANPKKPVYFSPQNEIETRIKRFKEDMDYLKNYVEESERNIREIREIFGSLEKIEFKKDKKLKALSNFSPVCEKQETDRIDYKDKPLRIYEIAEISGIPRTTLYGIINQEKKKDIKERKIKLFISEEDDKARVCIPDLIEYFKGTGSLRHVKKLEGIIKYGTGDAKSKILKKESHKIKPRRKERNYLTVFELSKETGISNSTIQAALRYDSKRPPEERYIKCDSRENELVFRIPDLINYFEKTKNTNAVDALENYIRYNPERENMEIRYKKRIPKTPAIS